MVGGQNPPCLFAKMDKIPHHSFCWVYSSPCLYLPRCQHLVCILSPVIDNCPYLNQLKGGNECRKDFMINLDKRMVLDRRIEHTTSWIPIGQASNWATRPGIQKLFSSQLFWSVYTELLINLAFNKLWLYTKQLLKTATNKLAKPYSSKWNVK